MVAGRVVPSGKPVLWVAAESLLRRLFLGNPTSILEPDEAER